MRSALYFHPEAFMKAIQFQYSLTRYALSKVVGHFYPPAFYGPLSLLRYLDVPQPSLPHEDWVKIQVKMAGICGSDINLIRLHDSPATSPFVSFPFVIGHENLGIICEAGSAAKDFEVGERVVVDPLLTCATRGIAPPCKHCQQGEYSRCENFAKGNLSAGLIIGSCRDTGGGWGSHFVAHRSQVFRVPPEVTDENATLVDGLCSALHPVMRNFPSNKDAVLIVGGGLIGLCAIASLRALGSRARILALVKYGFQGDLARHYGADQVFQVERGNDYYREIAEAVGATLYKPVLGKRVMMGGADWVFECVGSDASIDDALRFTRAGGTMVLVGLAAIPRGIDWTPIWLKELRVTGSSSSSTENYRGGSIRTYQLALDLMKEGRLDLSPLLTHRFRLEEYKKALEVLFHKERNQAVKVAFWWE
jgi:threonine dehydrogenase-like Zn-dependent dehydrogenase